jgi:hypothetical protein
MKTLREKLNSMCGHMLSKPCCGCGAPITEVREFTRSLRLYTYGLCTECAGDPRVIEDVQREVYEAL